MYRYQDMRESVFKDAGQRKLLKIRDNARNMIGTSGAVRMQELMSCVTGDAWETMACVDRLVELGELREVEQKEVPFGQHRIFVAPE